ncbi:MAG: translation initiation factor IF-2 N-terminal domain-containing protein, partial [Myxococcales bacterium]|nr:translation initiation factor IF-2 N-terminal domain-containing protein [Myxococcales bacterium]
MARVRVYELAREFNMPQAEVVAKVRGLGIDVKNHMSSIELEDVQRLKRALEKERSENRETKRLSKTVFRRRSRGSADDAPAKPRAAAAAASPAPRSAPPRA